MFVEQIVELLGKRSEFTAVSVLDASRTNDCLEELTLKDDLLGGMDIIGLDAEALVQLLEVFFFLFFILAA